MLSACPFATLALAGLLIACETPAPSALPETVPDTTEVVALEPVPDPVPAIDRAADNRLIDLLEGRGPLRLTRHEMRLLVDSLLSGPYAGHYGVHGPDVSETIDFNGDRRPDRFIFLAQSWGVAGAAYVQQSNGAYKLVGTLDTGGFAVCPTRGGAEVYTVALTGYTEGGELINRYGRGDGQRLWVTSDTMIVREAFSIDPAEYLDEMSDAERAAAWQRLLRYVDRTAPRPGCITGAEFDG